MLGSISQVNGSVSKTWTLCYHQTSLYNGQDSSTKLWIDKKGVIDTRTLVCVQASTAENATGVEAVVVRDLDELLKQIKDIEEKIQSFADEEKAHAHAHNRVKAEAGKVLIATPGEKINLRTYTEPVPAVEDATPTL